MSFLAPGIPTPDSEPVWKCVCTLSGYHSRDIYDISWSSSGLIATAGGDNAIRIFKQVQYMYMYMHMYNIIMCMSVWTYGVNAVYRYYMYMCVNWSHPKVGIYL